MSAMQEQGQVERLRADARGLAFNEGQYQLFRASEPEFFSKRMYWDTVVRALAYAQDELPASNSRSLADLIEVDNPASSVTMMVAHHLSFTVQRWAVPLATGELRFEPVESWVNRALSELRAGGVLTYWHKSEVEALIECLWERADVARFVGAIREYRGAGSIGLDWATD